jgi:hypothetical protein
VWGSRANDVWAVGGRPGQSLVLHSDGASWTPIEVSTNALLYTVYGFSDSDIYAVGEAGTVIHYDGQAWTPVTTGTQVTLFGLWGASGDDVWIVGGDVTGKAGAIALRGSHGSFQTVDLPTDLVPSMLYKAHGFASDDVMLVGTDGAVLRWNGAQWSRDAVPTSEPLLSTWGRGPEDVYAVGGRLLGEVIHSDGQQWSQVAQLPGEGLTGVFTSANRPTIAVAPHDVFELGVDGTITPPELPELASGTALHGVWGDELGTTYVVGGTLEDPNTAISGTILSRR